ncbi:MAG: AraC family transcriptional regulator [Epulopiscium sp.]|nr:AraC family transcriptional regulator [Candidatus Epulonipiscium sp.]
MDLLKENEHFSIDRVKRKAFFEMSEAHFHPYYEIYYLVSGKRKVFINHTLYTVDKGSIVIFKKGCLHRTTFIADETHERVVLNFTDQFLKELYQEFGKESIIKCFEKLHILLPPSRRVFFEELLQKIEYEYHLNDDFSKFLIKNHVYELIIFLVRCQTFQDNPLEEADIAHDKIQKMAKYICENYDRPITLEEMAKMANMSITYFSKKFKKITGFGFKEYLNNIRVKEAAHLLLETRDSITNIALKCGFTDSNYFGDVFKKVKGMSPSKYRKSRGII